jgi:hypothetical protein
MSVVFLDHAGVAVAESGGNEKKRSARWDKMGRIGMMAVIGLRRPHARWIGPH